MCSYVDYVFQKKACFVVVSEKYQHIEHKRLIF